MPTQIARVLLSSGEAGVALVENGRVAAGLPGSGSLAELWRLPGAELRRRLDAAGSAQAEAYQIVAPIDGQTEVWAAGVTYKRSEEARVEESATPDIYSRVYRAESPELSFKATARSIAG